MNFKDFENYVKELEAKYKAKFTIDKLSIFDFNNLESLQVISLNPKKSK